MTYIIFKVDFFWINRDQKSFEWFFKLLNQLEEEQEADEAGQHKFLDIHMYLTAALQKTDMRAIALQTAIEVLHKKVFKIFNYASSYVHSRISNSIYYHDSSLHMMQLLYFRKTEMLQQG